MKEYKRKVTILQKLDPSTFAITNHKIYGGSGRLLGSSKHAENALLAEGSFLKTIIPTILGINKNSSEWERVVANYLHSFEVNIPKGGKDLNVSYTVDMDNVDKMVSIKKLASEKKAVIKTDDDIINLLNGFDKVGKANVGELDLYKYVTPVNVLQYFTYIFALHHNRVANTEALVVKSSNIEFYMITELDIKNDKIKAYELTKALARTMNKIDDSDELREALYSVLDITAGDKYDKAIALDEMSKMAPRKIMAAVDDKNIMLRARLEEYIRKGLFKRIPHSSMIVDANDGTLIIGNNNTEAMTFLTNAKNEALLSQFEARYKSL